LSALPRSGRLMVITPTRPSISNKTASSIAASCSRVHRGRVPPRSQHAVPGRDGADGGAGRHAAIRSLAAGTPLEAMPRAGTGAPMGRRDRLATTGSLSVAVRSFVMLRMAVPRVLRPGRGYAAWDELKPYLDTLVARLR